MRHGLRELTLSGESLSADMNAVAPFQQKIQKLMREEGYSRDQVFNADETGLWWKQLPSKSLCYAREIQPKITRRPRTESL